MAFDIKKHNSPQVIKIKAIWMAIAIVLVLVPSITMMVVCSNAASREIGNQNLWLHLNIVLNTGISFSQLQDNTILVYILQISLSTIVLLICILFSNKWYYTLCLTAIFTGGFFNVLQRATPVTFNFSIDGYAAGEKIHNVVVDYFEINGFAVFNFPDSFIVGGTILGAAIYFVITIIAFVNNKDYQVDKSNSINLFIDSTQKKFNICIFQNDKIVEKFSIETNNNLTDIAIEHIDKLLNKIGITSKEINNIYLTVGPGSFTGVRIGNLIAKSWASVNKIEIYAIDSLQMQVIKNGISILDARGNKFYAGVYKNDKLVGKIKIMTPEQISKLATKNKLQVFKDYEDKDNLIFENLFFHLKDFKKVSPTELKSLYIKKPLE